MPAVDPASQPALYMPDVNVLVAAATRLYRFWSTDGRDAPRGVAGMLDFLTASDDDRLRDLAVAVSTGTLVATPLLLIATVNKIWELSQAAEAAAAQGQPPGQSRRPQGRPDPDAPMVWPSRDMVATFVLKGLTHGRLLLPVTHIGELMPRMHELHRRALGYEAELERNRQRMALEAGVPADPRGRVQLVAPDISGREDDRGLVGSEDLKMFAMVEAAVEAFGRPVTWASADSTACAVAHGIELGPVVRYSKSGGRWVRQVAGTAPRVLVEANAAGRSREHDMARR